MQNSVRMRKPDPDLKSPEYINIVAHGANHSQLCMANAALLCSPA